MASELIPGYAHDLLPFLLLTVNLSFMMVVLKARNKMKRETGVILGLVSTGTAALVTLNAFPEYSLDPTHISGHLMFSITVLLYGKLLVPEEAPTVLDRLILLELTTFDRFQYALAQMMMSIFDRIRDALELNTFDRFQYAFAQTIASLASGTRKIHTGDLNLSMIGFLAGLILCLLLLLQYAPF